MLLNFSLKNLKSSKRTFVFAEAGNNHEGSLRIAKKIILEANKCGVDAVKFQTFVPSLYYSNDQKERLKKLKKFQLSYDDFKKLIDYGKNIGITVFSTPFDNESAEFLNEYQKFFKISSGDNNFFPLIEQIISYNKPVIISTGLSDYSLLKKVYNLFKKKWGYFTDDKFLVFLHCVSAYPTKLEDANLQKILSLKKKFKDVIVGYSDHVIGIEAAYIASIMGANIIEKHFTLDRKFSNFRDHKLSADPKQMKTLITRIKKFYNATGTGNLMIQDCEKENLLPTRRSLAASRSLNAKKKIIENDLIWVRPGNGIIEKKEIIGKKIKKKMKFSESFSKSNLL
tara:strand:- start:28478 stop:29497 length:1020 start_codon:yes stop_codon:yes gene_type:complete